MGCERRERFPPDAKSLPMRTFTFTLNCHLGKTHSHRSRGDTTWKAQRNFPCEPPLVKARRIKEGHGTPVLQVYGVYGLEENGCGSRLTKVKREGRGECFKDSVGCHIFESENDFRSTGGHQRMRKASLLTNASRCGDPKHPLRHRGGRLGLLGHLVVRHIVRSASLSGGTFVAACIVAVLSQTTTSPAVHRWR